MNEHFDFSFLNSIFDNIYVLYINDFELFNAKKKFNFFNINVEFFKGIDGYNSSNYYDYLEKFKYKKFHLNQDIILLSKGQYGQLLSLCNIIKNAISNSYNKILIFEPDIYFSSNFKNNLLNFKNNYYLLYLGCSQCYFYNYYTWNDINIYDNNISYYHAFNSLGCFSFAIDKFIFNDLLNILEKKNKPSDVLLTELQLKYKNMSYVLYPNIVICDVVNSKTSNYKNFNNQLNKLYNYKWFDHYIIKNFIKLYHNSTHIKLFINSFYHSINPNNIILHDIIKVYGFHDYHFVFDHVNNIITVYLSKPLSISDKFLEFNNFFINYFTIFP